MLSSLVIPVLSRQMSPIAFRSLPFTNSFRRGLWQELCQLHSGGLALATAFRVTGPRECRTGSPRPLARVLLLPTAGIGETPYGNHELLARPRPSGVPRNKTYLFRLAPPPHRARCREIQKDVSANATAILLWVVVQKVERRLGQGEAFLGRVVLPGEVRAGPKHEPRAVCCASAPCPR